MPRRVSNGDGRQTALDLFSGCGGLTYGLKAAGFRVCGAVELDVVAAATYLRNHRKVAMRNADNRTIDAKRWMRDLGLAQGELDLLAGCPPCQGFSALRTRNGAHGNRDKRNALVFEMARFAVAFRPKTIMMENVPGLQKRRIFREFCARLRGLGYIVKVTVEDVQHFGVPQRRRRLILLAARNVTLTFASRSKRRVTVRDRIGGLPAPGVSGDVLHDYGEDRMASTRARIGKIPKDGGGRMDLPTSEQLPCHRASDGFKDIYGRMAWDSVSPTITTGCYNPSKGRFLHPEEDRCITMREAALLQSFPRSFQVPPGTTKTQVARMLGNALPPEFIRRHATELRRALNRMCTRKA